MQLVLILLDGKESKAHYIGDNVPETKSSKGMTHQKYLHDIGGDFIGNRKIGSGEGRS